MCSSGVRLLGADRAQARRLVITSSASLGTPKSIAHVLGDLGIESLQLAVLRPHLLRLAELEPRRGELVAGVRVERLQAGGLGQALDRLGEAAAVDQRYSQAVPGAVERRVSSTARASRAIASSCRPAFCRTKPRLNSVAASSGARARARSNAAIASADGLSRRTGSPRCSRRADDRWRYFPQQRLQRLQRARVLLEEDAGLREQEEQARRSSGSIRRHSWLHLRQRPCEALISLKRA